MINTNDSVDNFLEATSYFIQNLSATTETVKESVDNLDKFYFAIIDQNDKRDLTQILQNLEDEHRKLYFFMTNIDENKTNIEKSECAIQELKSTRAKKESECSQLEKKVNSYKDKFDSLLKYKEDISRKKDEILAYKVLTGVEFIYNTKRVMGTIRKDPPRAFDLNPQEFSQEEISQKLWDLVLQN